MKLRELDLTYFEATLIPPVRQLTHVEKPDILLEDYLQACDEKYHLLESHQQFVALRLFLSGDDIHVHAVLWYGHPDRCLVLVLNRLTETILGHHFLDLPDSPDEHGTRVPKPNPPPRLHFPEARDIPKD
jgi:hypothetical protein